MSDISIIEWAVYGLISYSSMLMLIISTIKEVPMTKRLSIIRAIYMIPGVICSGVLTMSGVNIVLPQTVHIMKDLNSTNTWSDTTTVNNIVLQSPVWTMVHLLFFTVLLVYVITQILLFFTKHDDED